MANVIEKATSSRGGAIAVGIMVAVIAAILLIVYITRYKSSVDSTAAAVPVLVAKRLIPKGTPGTTVATKQLYQSTSVPDGQRPGGAISDPNALNGRLAVADIYPGSQLTLNNFSAEASARSTRSSPAGSARVTMAIDPVKGSLANVASGDHVDIYTQVTRDGRTVIQLFRVERHGPSGARRRRRQRRPQGGDRRRRRTSCSRRPRRRCTSSSARPPAPSKTAQDARRPLDRDRQQQGSLGRMAETLRTLVAVDSGLDAHEIANTVTSDACVSVVGDRRRDGRGLADAAGQLVRRARRRLPGLLGARARADRRAVKQDPTRPVLVLAQAARRAASSAASSRPAPTTS